MNRGLQLGVTANTFPTVSETHDGRRAILRCVLFSTALVVGSVATLDGCGATMRPPAPPGPADTLYALTKLQVALDDNFRYLQLGEPEIAVWAGSRVNRLTDVSQEKVKNDAQFARALLSELDAINVQALPEDDYVSWLVLRWDLDVVSGWPAFYWTKLWDLSPGQSPLDVTANVLRGQRIVDAAGAESFRILVDSVEAMVGGIRRALTLRADRDIRIPSDQLPRVVAHVRSFIAPASVSPFGLPAGFTVSRDTAWQGSLQRALGEIIENRINLALESLARFLEGAYQKEAPVRIGMAQYPGGRAHYDALLRFHTTLDISPEAAHAIGLREASRLAALTAASRIDAGLPADRDSLVEQLQRDLRFHLSEDSLADGSLAAAAGRLFEDAARRLDSLFRPGPLSPLSIGAMAGELSTLGPLSSYRPPSVNDPIARYRLNVDRLRRRSLLELPAMVHEDLMPGLHHQQALQRESGSLPPSRRVGWHGGFVRGWQVYALDVADSVLQRGPASRFGARLRELSHACGLVVDTGINALSWTRGEALAFLRAHLPWDDEELEREFIVRATGQPAVMTAATLGARELRGMRRWAEQELGDDFDLAAFHRELLRIGSVPLPVLGAHLERWLWEENERIRRPMAGPPGAPSR